MLIVTYHAIADERSLVTTAAAEFASDIARLADAGFSFVSLADCADWLKGVRSLPERAVAVTFDDAYASVTRAIPILGRHRVPATVFVIAGRIGADNGWPGQWSSIPRLPLASAADLRLMVSSGIVLGAHSCSHRVLTRLSDDDLRREVVECGDRLEQLIGRPVREFAYPYGSRTEREIAAVRQRYDTACNARPAVVGPGKDRHDLPRLDCHDLRLAVRMGLLRTSALPPYLAIRRGLRAVRRLVA